MMLILVFLSGFAGLVYEVLWMKQIGLLFGNTSHAAAVTLAAFFGGLAAGSWLWGRRSARLANPLRSFAWLEAGIALTALLYFVVLQGYHAIYPLLYQHIASEQLLLLVKFGLALLLVFPPALFMGGTIPIMGQVVIATRSEFGRSAALLYGVNTLGAALGAYFAGFHFPLWFGFSTTLMLAMGLTGTVAVTARILAGRLPPHRDVAELPPAADGPVGSRRGIGQRAVLFLCFLSGFGVLALEVLWTRMFSQVFENSVYTFAAILVTVLVCLAVGSLLSSRLARLSASPVRVLVTIVFLAGAAIAITPFVFMEVTDGLRPLTVLGGWAPYIVGVFRRCFLAIGLPATLVGIVFPYLMKHEEVRAAVAGKTLGRLAAVNTLGAILGSLLCGFLFLETFGMWRTMQWLATLYLVVALVLSFSWRRHGMVARLAAAALLVGLFTLLDPCDLPVTSVDPDRHGERLIETWEGSDCTVAVVRSAYGISIKVNSHYGLGSTGSIGMQVMQAEIPLKVHPQPDDIFFLGMGTGITAGRALDPEYGVERVITCELAPNVIEAARKYIANTNGTDYTSGLFSDPRSTILAEDGRHYLMATPQLFDLIDADLFIPYRSGAGSLYTKEHFENARRKLKPGGLFFQWLPLYQVTENEFSIIARTMLEAFEYVTLWRNNFQPGSAVVALVGHADGTPLPPCDIDSRESKALALAGKTHHDLANLSLPFNPKTVTLFYCGNLSAARDVLFTDAPVNTDDRPLIEYMAPRTFRAEGGVQIPWFVGPRFARLVDRLHEICPPEQDPYLVNRTPENRRLPLAGAAFHWARLWQIMGNEHECAQAWQRFRSEWTGDPL